MRKNIKRQKCRRGALQMVHQLTIKLQNTEYSSACAPPGVRRYSITCASFCHPCPCPSCRRSCCSSASCSNVCWHPRDATSFVKWQWPAPFWPGTCYSVGSLASLSAKLAGSLSASHLASSSASLAASHHGTSCAFSSWSSREMHPSYCWGAVSPLPCQEALALFHVPAELLPDIKSASRHFPHP